MGFSKAFYFPWLELEGDDPGDTRLSDLDSKNNHQQQEQPAANLAQELFGRAYPPAGRIIRSRERQQSGAAGAPANARDGAAGGARVATKKMGAGQRQRGARKQGDRHVNAEAVDDEAPALKLYDLNEFPPLK